MKAFNAPLAFVLIHLSPLRKKSVRRNSMKELIKEHQKDINPALQLHDWVEYYRPFAANGQSANYIPALGKVNDSQLGICVLEPDGTMIHMRRLERLFYPAKHFKSD